MSPISFDGEGRLTRDKQEEIDTIIWRVDGKVKSIKRQATSQKNNVSFDYDPMGQRTAKHVYTRNDELLSSTYYILDAQGNVMSTYNLNIDTVNTSLEYYQAEKHIYGSSRLGMLKDSVNVLGSAYGDTDSSNVIHKLGNKRYELSNHLGNVLTVISDKPIPHNNGGTVDYWEANISSAYDYSPFGVMLTGRTFEGKQTVCHDSTVQATQNALEEGFGSWGSWMPTNNCGITYVTDTMKISNQKSTLASIGADITFTTGLGAHYVSFNIVGINWGDPIFNQIKNITVVIRDNNNNVIINENYSAIGSYNLSFTPTASGVTYRLHIFNRNASVNAMFELDDVLISYEDETIVTDCREVDAGYRYKFNGMEVDDEIKGKGNSYTTEFRQYDPRLGRWLSIDPLFQNFPWQSPYASFDNNPIRNNDPKGEAAEDQVDGEENGEDIEDGEDDFCSSCPAEELDEVSVVGNRMANPTVKEANILKLVVTIAKGTWRFVIKPVGQWISKLWTKTPKPKIKPSSAKNKNVKNAIKNSNPYKSRTLKQNLSSKKKYEGLLKEHKEKLSDYIKNPDKNDHKGLLKNVSKEIREKRIKGRINELNQQINKHKGELGKINDAIKTNK